MKCHQAQQWVRDYGEINLYWEGEGVYSDVWVSVGFVLKSFGLIFPFLFSIYIQTTLKWYYLLCAWVCMCCVLGGRHESAASSCYTGASLVCTETLWLRRDPVPALGSHLSCTEEEVLRGWKERTCSQSHESFTQRTIKVHYKFTDEQHYLKMVSWSVVYYHS